MSWRAGAGVVTLLVVLVAAAACGRDTTDATSDEVWDLTKPPTRAEVGMEEGRSVAVHESNEARPVTLGLPGGVVLDIPLELLTFDSMGSVPQETSDPTGLDAKTDRVPLERTVKLYTSTLDQLGMKTDGVDAFERDADRTSGNEITSPVTTQKYGYLELNVVAHFEPVDQKGYVTLVGAWGATLKGS